MIDKEILYSKLNKGILEERYLAFEKNLEKNLDLIHHYGGLRKIVSRLQNKNVIIVGAGPSLENNFALLKKYQQRDSIVILSTDMALKPLMKHGIFPEFVISCETNPVDFFGDVDTENMGLLAFSCMSNINLRRWRGSISFFNWMVDSPEYSALWDRAGTDLGYIATGSIVTTQAVSLALGCDIASLVLVGNDLGFADRFYVKESLFYGKNLCKYNRYTNFQTLDTDLSRKRREYEIQRGKELFFTNKQFLAAKMWLEELFVKQSIPVYDCSIPGCSGKYVKKVDLKDFFKLIDGQGNRSRRKRRKK
ncbi:MAG: DUF115 domain-containing protein [bacterium]|nr:DUF115 domain-containing protein [bacterium]